MIQHFLEGTVGTLEVRVRAALFGRSNYDPLPRTVHRSLKSVLSWKLHSILYT